MYNKATIEIEYHFDVRVIFALDDASATSFNLLLLTRIFPCNALVSNHRTPFERLLHSNTCQHKWLALALQQEQILHVIKASFFKEQLDNHTRDSISVHDHLPYIADKRASNEGTTVASSTCGGHVDQKII